MKWIIEWCRVRLTRCSEGKGRPCPSLDAEQAAAARADAERKLAEAREQGPEVSAVAGRLRRVRPDDFAAMMTDAMRGT